MPFLGHKYYGSENDMWSFQSQGGGKTRARRDGWCAAGSAIWCSNMLFKGTPPGKSKPDLSYAGVLQVKYRWDRGSRGKDVLALLHLVNLKGEPVFYGNRNEMLSRIERDPGVYWFRAHGHAMAGDTRPRRKLWYDIETGLFGYDYGWAMRWDLADRYPQADGWEAFKCAVG